MVVGVVTHSAPFLFLTLTPGGRFHPHFTEEKQTLWSNWPKVTQWIIVGLRPLSQYFAITGVKFPSFLQYAKHMIIYVNTKFPKIKEKKWKRFQPTIFKALFSSPFNVPCLRSHLQWYINAKLHKTQEPKIVPFSWLLVTCFNILKQQLKHTLNFSTSVRRGLQLPQTSTWL